MGSWQQKSTVVLIHVSINSFNLSVLERRVDGEYKLEMVKTIEVLVSFSLKMVLSDIRQKSMPDRITFDDDNNGEFFLSQY